MRIDKLVRNCGLPEGLQTLGVVSNKTLRTKKWGHLIKSLPHGEVRGRTDCTTQYNTVVLFEDAKRLGIPFITFKSLKIGGAE